MHERRYSFLNINLCRYAIVFPLLLGILAACAKKAPLEIQQLHISALPPGQSSAAAYMLLRNNTEKTLVLNYVHSPIASDVEVHRVIYDQGMMQMRKVKHLTIDPGVTMHFQPGGYHLMLMGIEKAPQPGERFTITLEFESGYSISSEAEVRPLGH